MMNICYEKTLIKKSFYLLNTITYVQTLINPSVPPVLGRFHMATYITMHVVLRRHLFMTQTVSIFNFIMFRYGY